MACSQMPTDMQSKTTAVALRFGNDVAAGHYN